MEKQLKRKTKSFLNMRNRRSQRLAREKKRVCGRQMPTSEKGGKRKGAWAWCVMRLGGTQRKERTWADGKTRKQENPAVDEKRRPRPSISESGTAGEK